MLYNTRDEHVIIFKINFELNVLVTYVNSNFNSFPGFYSRKSVSLFHSPRWRLLHFVKLITIIHMMKNGEPLFIVLINKILFILLLF